MLNIIMSEDSRIFQGWPRDVNVSAVPSTVARGACRRATPDEHLARISRSKRHITTAVVLALLAVARYETLSRASVPSFSSLPLWSVD